MDSYKLDIVKEWLEFFPLQNFNGQNAIKIRDKITAQVKKMLDKTQLAQAWEWARLLPRDDYLELKNQIGLSAKNYVVQALSSNRPDRVSQWFTEFPLETFETQDQLLFKREIHHQLQNSANQKLFAEIQGWISLGGYMSIASLNSTLVYAAQKNQHNMVNLLIGQGANTNNPAYWQAQLENAVNANQPDKAEQCISHGAKPIDRLLSAGLTKSANTNQPGLAKKWLLLGTRKNTEILDKGLAEAVSQGTYQCVYQWLDMGATKNTAILNKGVEEEIKEKNYSKILKWLSMGADKNTDILKKTIKDIPFDQQMLWLNNGVKPEADFLQNLVNQSVIDDMVNRVIALRRYVFPDPEFIEEAIRKESIGNKRKHESSPWKGIQKIIERRKKKARVDQHPPI